MNLRNQTISALESLHQSGDEVDRCNIIRTLGVLKASESVPLLIKSLRDEDLDVCIDAAENLGKIGAIEAIPSLIESLENDPDGDVRTAVVNALGAIALQNPNNTDAIDTLLQIAYKRPENLDFLGEWDDYWDMQLNAVKALGKLGIEKAVPIMDEILTSDDHQDIESEVLTALAQIGHSGHKLLGKRLKSSPDRDRRRAAQALGHASTPESLSTLAEGLLDSAGEVREATLKALAKRQATQYIKAILIYLRDPDSEVKTAAIETIAQLGEGGAGLINGEQISEKLLPLLSDEDSQVRISALQFIANFSRIEAFSKPLQRAIHKMLADKVAAVAAKACDTVAKLQDQTVIPDLLLTLRKQDIHPTVRRQAALALGAMPESSQEIIETLSAAIADSQQPVRLGALQALSQLFKEGKATDEKVLGTLLAAAHRELIHEEPEDNEPDAEMATQEPPSDTPEATVATEGSESDASAAEIATAPIDAPIKEKPLSTLDAILQSNSDLHEQFHESGEPKNVDRPDDASEISESEDDALQEFYNIIDSQKGESKKRQKVKELPLAQDVQLLAIRMLANLNSDEVQEILIELLSNDDELVQNEAVASIEEIAKRSRDNTVLIDTLGPLMNRLEYGAPVTQIHAARALGHLGHPAALNLLHKFASDGETGVRIASLEGMNQLLQKNLSNAEIEGFMLPEEIPYSALFDVMGQSMLDSEVGVRIAAAEALTSARGHNENQFDQQQLISKLIDTALQGEGGQARHMGKLLCLFEPEVSISQLLTKLENTKHSVERRFIIEMIEEILHPQDGIRLSA